jgi:hypothetical protein
MADDERAGAGTDDAGEALERVRKHIEGAREAAERDGLLPDTDDEPRFYERGSIRPDLDDPTIAPG